MGSDYRFATIFTVAAPIEQVHAALSEPGAWLDGFADIERHDLVSRGGPDHVGDRIAVVHRAPRMAYRLRYTVETVTNRAPERLHWRVEGDLVGTGTWELESLDDVTDCRFLWEVATTKRWMRLVAPLARPLFVREHDRSMRTAVVAFGRHVGAPVSRYRSVEGKRVARPAGSARLAAGLLLLGALASRTTRR